MFYSFMIFAFFQVLYWSKSTKTTLNKCCSWSKEGWNSLFSLRRRRHWLRKLCPRLHLWGAELGRRLSWSIPALRGWRWPPSYCSSSASPSASAPLAPDQHETKHNTDSCLSPPSAPSASGHFRLIFFTAETNNYFHYRLIHKIITWSIKYTQLY